ncbi:hypothetical protein JYU14_01195 [Simkania negevensis]|uniref:Sodium:proton antiporter n=1 Tax=Simkania negevensis TaxID=83561 RepID=A0ABS3AUM6_9BACT|nr:hypothetical protein [Simkania negevensis]
MSKVFFYSFLVVLGLIGSQLLTLLPEDIYTTSQHIIRLLTMFCLAFIMIHVGLEFTLNKKNARSYVKDFFIAATAAGFPWILCATYFLFFFPLSDSLSIFDKITEVSLLAHFAAPTSAGVLFSMLAAAKLGSTWMFRKTRVLAIFDDLDTIIFMIPLKIALLGFRWELGLVLFIIFFLLLIAWKFLHKFDWPVRWRWVLFYAIFITLASEAIYHITTGLDDIVAIHIEVLFPAFVLGCIIKRPAYNKLLFDESGLEPRDPTEHRASNIVSECFMFLVGLYMPPIIHNLFPNQTGHLLEPIIHISWQMLVVHVIVITILSNIGKMFPALCYRKETSWNNRLAVAIGMFPRGEVGAGIIVIALAHGVKGPIIAVAVLSLFLNLLLTGGFIAIIKYLVRLKVNGAAEEVNEAAEGQG